MKHFLISLLFVYAFFKFENTYSQSFSVVAKVKNTLDSAAIPFAHASISSSGIGTYTNEVGVFEFHIPDSLREKSIEISHIGFKTFKISIKSISTKDTLTIFLQPDVIMLNSIIISAKNMKKDSLLLMVNRALKSIKKNYTSKPFYMEGFYREAARKDCTYVRLIEAAFEIQDFGYDTNIERRRTQMMELRKSEDYIERGWITWFGDKIFGKTNELLRTLNSADVVRKYKSNHILSYSTLEGFPKAYTFILEDIQKYDGDTIYVMSFLSTVDADKVMRHGGKIFINKSDYAILRFEHGYLFNENPTIKNAEMIKAFKKGTEYNTDPYRTAIYKKKGDKYFLSLIQATNTIEKGCFDVTLMINHITTDKKEYERIRRRDLQEKETDLYEQDFKYNSEFWKNYNMLLINPLIKKVETDLSKEKALDQQFKEKGKKDDDN